MFCHASMFLAFKLAYTNFLCSSSSALAAKAAVKLVHLTLHSPSIRATLALASATVFERPKSSLSLSGIPFRMSYFFCSISNHCANSSISSSVLFCRTLGFDQASICIPESLIAPVLISACFSKTQTKNPPWLSS